MLITYGAETKQHLYPMSNLSPAMESFSNINLKLLTDHNPSFYNDIPLTFSFFL